MFGLQGVWGFTGFQSGLGSKACDMKARDPPKGHAALMMGKRKRSLKKGGRGVSGWDLRLRADPQIPNTC